MMKKIKIFIPKLSNYVLLYFIIELKFKFFLIIKYNKI